MKEKLSGGLSEADKNLRDEITRKLSIKYKRLT